MDHNYQVEIIDMAKIYSDDEFNCRGHINPFDVKDLAQDIAENDLQFPIAVQPACDVEGGVPAGFEFRIIAGHRRFMAFRVLKRSQIPAMIKKGLSEVQARIHNLSENLQRKELNILQEAKAIKRLKDYGLVQEATAQAIGRTRSWVQIRYNLLELPEVIQEEAAAGVLNQAQIKQLYSLKSDNERFEAVRKIKTALINGQKGISVAKPPKADPYKKKRRQKNEVQEMIQHIAKGSPVGFGLATRALAWANGEINTAELYMDIKRESKALGKPYRIPVQELDKASSSTG
jgi:ParB family chromosome partitioning protein